VDPANLQYGPNGATMSISQQGCINPDGTNNPACCNSILNTAISSPYYGNRSTPVNFTVCASWSGAHLASNGCYQYGVFETEVMVNSMPAEGGARFYGGLYQMGCGDATGITSRTGGYYPNCDPSWCVRSTTIETERINLHKRWVMPSAEARCPAQSATPKAEDCQPFR